MIYHQLESDTMEYVLHLLVLYMTVSVSPLYITIDAHRGNDSLDCLEVAAGDISCQSLKYVADNLPTTINITVKIFGLSLTLQDSVDFANTSGLSIIGQGTIIKCNGTVGGIFLSKCLNTALHNFTVENCEMFGVHFSYCHNVTVSQVTFNDNNGHGLILWNTRGTVTITNSTFSNNYWHNSLMTSGGMSIGFTQSNSSPTQYNITKCYFISNLNKANGVPYYPVRQEGGGGIYIEISSGTNNVSIILVTCYFRNNSAPSGGGMHISINTNSSGNSIGANDCYFISNNAFILGGGAVSVVMVTVGALKRPGKNDVYFAECNFNRNTANIGGAVALSITSTDCRHGYTRNDIIFISCIFTGNMARDSAAVDVNRMSHKTYYTTHFTVLTFISCQFIGNQAGVHLSQNERYQGNLYNAVVCTIGVKVKFRATNIFKENEGTSIYVTATDLVFIHGSQVHFVNNTGNRGGAILLADDAVLYAERYVKLFFQSNSAVIGGAICALPKLTNILYHKGTCFLDGQEHKRTFTFINNKATSGIGHDIFVSTLQPCLHYGNVTSLFTDGIIGNFNFSRHSLKTSVATAPVTMKLADNKTHLTPYPGIPYTINIIQLDEFNSTIGPMFPLSAKLITKTSRITIDLSYLTIANYTIVFQGQEGDNTTLVLEINESIGAVLFINVTMGHCPPGYILMNNTCFCSNSIDNLNYYGILHCVESKHAVITNELWAGYLENRTFATAVCLKSLCSYPKSKDNKHHLPLNYSLLNEYVCDIHRTGILCGNCITDSTTYYHSPVYTCGEFTHCQYGILLYIISEIIPVTIIFMVILFFNVNLTSGALYTFIFYSQIVNSHYCTASFDGSLNQFLIFFKTIYGIFDLDILEVEHLSFCLFKNATVMDLFLIKYLTTLYALFLIFATIIILRLNSLYSCIKLCHKCGRRNIRGSIINALTTFLVLCYYHCLLITLHILTPSYIKGLGGKLMKTVPLYNGNLEYLEGEHLKYAIPAVVCLIVIILPPPIILLAEPLLVRLSGLVNTRRNYVSYCLQRVRMKLKPFLDSFQGCFRDNCRCFAGFFFFYRILITLVPGLLASDVVMNCWSKELVLFLILLVHSICHPFQSKWHNNLDSFLLINLLVLNSFSLILVVQNPTETNSYDFAGIAVLVQLFLLSLPLLYITSYIGLYAYRYLKHSKRGSSPQENLSYLQSYNTFP